MDGMMRMMSPMEEARMNRSHGHCPPPPKTKDQQVDEVFARIMDEMKTLEGVPYYEVYRLDLATKLRVLRAGWISLLNYNRR